MTPAEENKVSVTMPQLGETVAEGTVLRWLKQVGQEVTEQEPLLEIATDKVDTEVPSPAAGVLLEIVVAEDETVAVGTVIARLGSPEASAEQPPSKTGADTGHGAPRGSEPEAGSTAQSADVEAIGPHAVPPLARVAATDTQREDSEGASLHRGPSAAVGAEKTAQPQDAAVSPSAGRRHQHSPRVRRLAHELGVDLISLRGTGPRGRVTPDDVSQAVQHDTTVEPPAPTPEGRAQLVTPRGGVTRALRTVVATVDMSAAWRAATRPEALARGAAAEDRLVAVITTVTASTLRAHPQLLRSAALENGLNVAVSRATAPRSRDVVVERADELNTDGIARRLHYGKPLAGTGHGESPEASFTLGFVEDDDIVVDVVDPPPGQVAAVGVSRATERVVVVDNDGTPGIGIRRTAYVALRFDQAKLDAGAARAFLRDLVARLASLPSTA